MKAGIWQRPVNLPGLGQLTLYGRIPASLAQPKYPAANCSGKAPYIMSANANRGYNDRICNGAVGGYMSFTRVPYTEEQKRRDEEHLQDVKFLEKNYEDLMAQYPEKWIAIKSQRVLAVSDDDIDLAYILRASGLGGQVSLIRHMTTEDVILILAGQ